MADLRAELLALLDAAEIHCHAKEDHWGEWFSARARARAALDAAPAPADGPAVPEGREPAAVAGEPSDEELLEIKDGAYCPSIDEVNDEDDSSWRYTSDYIRWLDENGTPQEQEAYAAKGLRAVFEAGRRWGRAALDAAPPEGPSLEEVEDLCEEHCFNVEGYESVECLQGLLNDAISRWGRPATPAAQAAGEEGA